MYRRKKSLSRKSLFIPALILCMPALLALAVDRTSRPEIRPTVPTADRTAGNRVFLERADKLKKNATDSFMTVVGDVVFTKGPMIMKCDSAHYYSESESLDAFGNVSMEQGDTLFVYADELRYDGPSEIATLYADYGKKVRLINRDVTLETDVFIYDLAIDLGYYQTGGKLYDQSNTLTSIKGEYVPSTKEANFYLDVRLNSLSETDTLTIYSDTLYYNTATHIAELYSPSEVINRRGIIYTRQGVYDTDSDVTTLYDRSIVLTRDGQRLTADTIFYNRTKAYGEAFGNMILTDSAQKLSVYGNYGFYDEAKDSSFVTGRAMIAEYSNEEDTLWLHGKYIKTFRQFDTTYIQEDTLLGIPASTKVDTSHVAVIHPKVRFYRSDLQGVCDSMRYTERDSTLRMFVDPVIWNEDRQVFGNVIEVLFNDSTIERATLPDMGFTAQHIEDEYYNQLSGKEMIAYFKAGEITQLDINGNVEIIMYPEDADSTFNKVVNAESSFLTANFRGRTTERIKLWPETTGTATPLFLAKKNLFYLPKFRWFDALRPRDRYDIFPPEEIAEPEAAIKEEDAEPEADTEAANGE